MYGYILAELLKRNTELHGKALEKKGKPKEWPGVARKIIIKELAKYKQPASVKSYAGFIWGNLRRQDVTTRQIYMLLTQWALLLTNKGLLEFHTEDYEALLAETTNSFEKGAEGDVYDVSPEEIVNEWEFMQNYLNDLHEICEKWIKNNE